MPLSSWISVTTALETPPPAPPDYLSVAAIPSDSVPFVGATKTYATSSEMLDDGWLSTDDAYLSAVQYFGQNDTDNPTRIVIIAKGTYTAQVSDLQVTDNTDGDYDVYVALLGGGPLVLVSTFTASGNTIQQIRDGLIANWTGADQTPTAQGTAIVRVTANVAGAPFLVSGEGPANNSFASAVVVTPNVGPYEEMDAAFDDNNFWGVIPDPGEDPLLMLEWSRWCEVSKETGSERRNHAFVQVDDDDIADGITPNTASLYEALGRTRTVLVQHANLVDKMSAAYFGLYGGTTPGTRDWHMRQVTGTSETSAIKYSSTEVDNLRDAKVAFTERFAATTSEPARVQWGQGSGGFFVVQKHAEDYWWLLQRFAGLTVMQSRAGTNLDDAGVSRYVAAAQNVNIQLAALGILDLGATTITATPASEISPSKSALGLYTLPDGGIVVATRLIPKLRVLDVSGTFATA